MGDRAASAPRGAGPAPSPPRAAAGPLPRARGPASFSPQSSPSHTPCQRQPPKYRCEPTGPWRRASEAPRRPRMEPDPLTSSSSQSSQSFLPFPNSAHTSASWALGCLASSHTRHLPVCPLPSVRMARAQAPPLPALCPSCRADSYESGNRWKVGCWVGELFLETRCCLRGAPPDVSVTRAAEGGAPGPGRKCRPPRPATSKPPSPPSQAHSGTRLDQRLRNGQQGWVRPPSSQAQPREGG